MRFEQAGNFWSGRMPDCVRITRRRAGKEKVGLCGHNLLQFGRAAGGRNLSTALGMTRQGGRQDPSTALRVTVG